jgi:hypothetical protein
MDMDMDWHGGMGWNGMGGVFTGFAFALGWIFSFAHRVHDRSSICPHIHTSTPALSRIRIRTLEIERILS